MGTIKDATAMDLSASYQHSKLCFSRLRRAEAPIETAVLNGFAEMLGHDILTARQICDGSCDFQKPVVGARRESRSVHRHLQKLRSLGINLAELFDFLRYRACTKEMLEGGLLRQRRKNEPKCAPFPNLALDSNAASVQLDRQLAECETKAC